jgi:hypothetical protein
MKMYVIFLNYCCEVCVKLENKRQDLCNGAIHIARFGSNFVDLQQLHYKLHATTATLVVSTQALLAK